MLKETSEVFQRIQDSPIKSLCIEGLNVQVQFETKISMVDGKMVSLIQGDSGSFCHYCTLTKADANVINAIEEGFFINKTYQTCLEAWNKIKHNVKSFTSKERDGQCHKPIIKCDSKPVIMHR